MMHALITLLATLALTSPAAAQDWPTRPTRIVSFLAPGGLSDMLARILAQNFETKFKSPFFVENRTGGGGVVGASLVAEQPPDGATLGITSASTRSRASPTLRSSAARRPFWWSTRRCRQTTSANSRRSPAKNPGCSSARPAPARMAT
jgi:tripartite-type tricarboxylate transporter receptor subunit TctC